VGTYEYAGCLTVPRVLYLRGNSLIQEPVRRAAAQSTRPWPGGSGAPGRRRAAGLFGSAGAAVHARGSAVRPPCGGRGCSRASQRMRPVRWPIARPARAPVRQGPRPAAARPALGRGGAALTGGA
jgi:hypothetical protein